MKKRYCFGVALLVLPVLIVLVFLVVPADPAIDTAGLWVRAGIGSLISISYGISLLKTANRMRMEREKWQGNSSQN